MHPDAEVSHEITHEVHPLRALLCSPRGLRGLCAGLAVPVFAQASSPWENAVGVLQQAFTSTIARGLSLVAIVVSGLTFAFGEGGSKRVLAGVLFGVGMAIAAVKFNTRHFDMEALIRTGTLDRQLANFGRESPKKYCDAPVTIYRTRQHQRGGPSHCGGSSGHSDWQRRRKEESRSWQEL
jgi:type IV secretory pathway VirB2 component (pilin)